MTALCKMCGLDATGDRLPAVQEENLHKRILQKG
jgi:hypothetical protein